MKEAHAALELASPARPVCAAIGVFDGLHLGHQAIVARTLADARACQGMAVVITFDPHPDAVVSPGRCPPLIYSLSRKRSVLASLGVDALLLLNFDESLRQRPAEEFVRDLARDLGQLRSLCVGAAFTFGHRRGGNLALLERLGAELGFQARGLPAVTLDGIAVSSTRIREAIRAGELDLAGRLLGRPYTLDGPVVTGDRLGTRIGFPTANVDTTGLALPPHGVYAVEVRVGDRVYPAVLNIGLRPTLASPAPRLQVEAHLLDVSLHLYGRRVEIAFKRFLRGEQRFASLAELQAAIARDIAFARPIFA